MVRLQFMGQAVSVVTTSNQSLLMSVATPLRRHMALEAVLLVATVRQPLTVLVVQAAPAVLGLT